ncbi:IclR family transcriptional regulator [Hoeflea sp. TYP-13]|uniref:IclR family transcriptional regulator n=1 Tax=Hoeflea sp. TYP-13 TaxID=3230023 RepID=UPI0034C5D04D
MSATIDSKRHLKTAKRLDTAGDAVSSEFGSAGVKQIQSVSRALTILEVLAAEGDALPLNELAIRAGLNQSTCHHLISTLVGRGYIVHLGRNRGYALGRKLHELADLAGRQADLAEVLKADIEALSEQFGRSVQLAVLSDTSLLTKLSCTQPDNQVEEPDEIIKMAAPHATATGKAILAWLPDAELARVVAANGLTGYTDKTITSLSGLIEQLRLVRRNGFAVDDEELKNGIVCIGSALRESSGAVVASISVTLPASEATPEYRKELSRSVIRAAQEFSKRLRNTKP